MAEYTDGRYVMAATDADGARDVIGLTSQVKFMREGFKRAGHDGALVLLLVADDELDEAVERIRTALDGEAAASKEQR